MADDPDERDNENEGGAGVAAPEKEPVPQEELGPEGSQPRTIQGQPGPKAVGPQARVPTVEKELPDARNARHQDVYAQVDASMKDKFDKQAPFAPSGWQPQTPTDVYQRAVQRSDYATQDQFETAKAARAEQVKSQNATSEQQMRGTGQRFYTDPYGQIQPIIEADSGKALFTPSAKRTPGVNPQTGEPAWVTSDKYGQQQYAHPKLSTNPQDPTDTTLYADFGDGTPQPFGDIDKLTKHPNWYVAKSAMKAQQAQRTAKWKEAIAPMKEDENQAKLSYEAAKVHSNNLDEQAAELQQQLQAAQAGKVTSMSADDIQAKLKDIAAQKTELDAKIASPSGGQAGGELYTRMQAAKVHRAMFESKMHADAYADQHAQRVESLNRQGLPLKGDPILASIEEAQNAHGQAITQLSGMAQHLASAPSFFNRMGFRSSTPEELAAYQREQGYHEEKDIGAVKPETLEQPTITLPSIGAQKPGERLPGWTNAILPGASMIPKDVAAGITNVLGKQASGLTSPENLALMIATAGTGKIVNRLVSTGFGVKMVRDAIKQAPDMWKTLNDPNMSRQAKIEAGGDFLATLVMGGVALKHGGKGGVKGIASDVNALLPEKTAASPADSAAKPDVKAPEEAPAEPPVIPEPFQPKGTPSTAEESAKVIDANIQPPAKSAQESAEAMQAAESEKASTAAHDDKIEGAKEGRIQSLVDELSGGNDQLRQSILARRKGATSDQFREALEKIADFKRNPGGQPDELERQVKGEAAKAGAKPISAETPGVEQAGQEKPGELTAAQREVAKSPETKADEAGASMVGATPEQREALAARRAGLEMTGAKEPAAGEKATPVDIGKRDEKISTGTGVATPHEEKMMADWKRNIADEKAKAKPVSDRAQYEDVQKKMTTLMASPEFIAKGAINSPEFKDLWKQNEEIKNRNGGNPPPKTEEPTRAPKIESSSPLPVQPAPDNREGVRGGNAVDQGAAGKGGVKEAGGEGKAAVPEVEKAARDTALSAKIEKAPKGGEVTMKTPDDEKVPVKGNWRVVEAADLLSSKDKNYDEGLQPRDRGRAASQAQISTIATKLDPELLSDSKTSDTGSPVIDNRGMVLSGNGRTEAIRQAYNSEGGQGGAYKAHLAEHADKFGLDRAAIEGMKKPVLVRQVNDFGGLTPEEFARRSNRQQVLGMSDSENATSDAKFLHQNPDVFQLFSPSETGDVLAATNREFLNKFIEATGDRAELVSKDGQGYNASKLIPRIRNAVLAAVVGPENRALIDSLVEDNEGIKKTANGLLASAPKLVGLKGTAYDLGPDLATALQDLVGLRHSGETLANHLSQTSLFGDAERSAISDFLLRELSNSKSAKAVTDFLGAYADAAAKIDTTTGDMFGQKDATPAELLQRSADAQRGAAPSDQGSLALGEPAKPDGQAGKENAVADAGVTPAVKPATPEEAFSAASKELEKAKVDFRAKKIDKAEFLKARDKFNEARAALPEEIAQKKAAGIQSDEIAAEAAKPGTTMRLSEPKAGDELAPPATMSRAARKAELVGAGVKEINGKPIDEANPAELTNAVGKLRAGKLGVTEDTLSGRAADAIAKAKKEYIKKTLGSGKVGMNNVHEAAFLLAMDVAEKAMRLAHPVETVIRAAIASFKSKYPGITDEDVTRLSSVIRDAQEEMKKPRAPTETPKTDAEPPVIAEKPATTGVAHRVSEARGVEAERGEGISPEESVERGRTLLKGGYDLDKAFADFDKTKAVSADLIAAARAKGEEFAKATNKAADEHGLASPEYKAALEAEKQMVAKIKPVQTEWHRGGQAQQGETEIDTGTFHGLARAFRESTGKDLSEGQAKAAKRIAGGVKDATDAADAARDKLLKETDDGARRTAETAKLADTLVRGFKAGEKWTPQEAKALWHMARTNYLDKGTTNFDEIRHGLADDYGLPVKDITNGLASPKGARVLTDDMYAKMSERRRVVNQAKQWVTEAKYPGYVKFFREIPRAFFNLATFGHGTVWTVTHAGNQYFLPKATGELFRDLGRSFKLMGVRDGGAYHERMMQDLVRDPNFIKAKRAGLANDPFRYQDDYQNAGVVKVFKEIGLMGNRGFDGMKMFRQFRFNQEWGAMPKELQTPDGAKLLADTINKATGITKSSKLPNWMNTVFFAPKLEMSRWAFLYGDPIKSAHTIARSLYDKTSVTPEATQSAYRDLRQKATMAGVYLAALGVNQGLLSASGSDQKVNFTDPKHGDWLSFKALGHNIGVIGPMVSSVRFLANMAHAFWGERSRLERLEGSRAEQAGTNALRYARGKLSPFAGVVLDAGSQSDSRDRPMPWNNEPLSYRAKATGATEKYSTGEYLAEHTLPIPLEEAATEMWRKQGADETDIAKWLKAITAGAMAGTTGVRVTPETPAQKKASGF